MNLHIFDHPVIKPFERFGIISPFFHININTLIATWIAMIMLVIIVLSLRKLLSIKSEFSLKIVLGLGVVINNFKEMVQDGLGYFDLNTFSFLFSLFCTTLVFNLTGVLPFLEEPTTDLNTTFALGAICFIYAQYQGLAQKGFGYFSKYFQPIFIFLPLNLLSQFLKIVSLSIRLFGNMISGAIIWGLLKNLIITKFGIPFSIAILCTWIVFIIESHRRKKTKSLIWQKIVTASIITVSLTPGFQFIFGLVHGIMQAYILAFLTGILIFAEKSENAGH